MPFLKQSTAAIELIGPFVDDTDGKTAETGLSIAQADIGLSKNGAIIASSNNAAGASHITNGWYSVPLDTTDTNTLGRLKLEVFKSGALPVWREFTVLPANVYDSLIGGSDMLMVDMQQIVGSSCYSGALPTVAAGASGGLPLLDAALSLKSDLIKIMGSSCYSGCLPTIAAGGSGGLPLLDAALALRSDLVKIMGSSCYSGCLPTVAAGGSAGLPLLDAALALKSDLIKIMGSSCYSGALPTVAAGTAGGLPLADAAGAVKIVSGSIVIKKNVQFTGFPFVMVDVSDHRTPLPGLTVTAVRSLDGQAFGACANSPTELSNGVYLITLDAADVNANSVVLKFSAEGADDRIIILFPQP